MHTPRQVIEDCVRMETEGGLMVVGTGHAVPVRFKALEGGLVTLQPLRSTPVRSSAVACVAFRYRRWAASFVAHVRTMGMLEISPAMPAEITMVDSRRSVRSAPMSVVTPVCAFVTVVDMSAEGIGLELPAGERPPALGARSW